MDTFYETYPSHIDNFVNKLVNKFDANRDDLLPALDRMERAIAEQKAIDKANSVNTIPDANTDVLNRNV